MMRPEELSPGQFVEITRMMFGTGPASVLATMPDVDNDAVEVEDMDEDCSGSELRRKVWRKLKHGGDR